MHPSYKGYFRNPTVFQDQVVFVCEDDLWQVPLSGGRALRLTSSRGRIFSPSFSPDGRWLACCGRDEGQNDIYLLPATGGPLRRLTFLNTDMRVVGWMPGGDRIIFWSTHQSVHQSADAPLYTVGIEGGVLHKLPYGPAHFIDFAPDNMGIVLGRNAAHNFRWKRYRGGMTGEIWIRANGKRKFAQLRIGGSRLSSQGNPVSPFWFGSRLFFVSDHQGIGNLYSTLPNGSDLLQETFHEESYVRNPATDGQTIVYHAHGDLYSLNPASKVHQAIDVEWRSPRVQLQRRFFFGDEYLENAAIHPEGHSVALTARGALFSMPLWEKAVTQHGRNQGIRSRLTQWLPDGRLATLLDLEKTVGSQATNGILPSEEKLGIFSHYPQLEPELILDLPPGRVQSMKSAPQKNRIALTTNRMELFLLEIDSQNLTRLDDSPLREIRDIAFSPDGNWLAYSKHLTLELTAIFLVNLNNKTVHQLTQPVRYDFAPAFDPHGYYLYFLSSRTYNPVADSVQVGVTFSRSIKPYLITLQKETGNPLSPQPHAPGKNKDPEDDGRQTSGPSEYIGGLYQADEKDAKATREKMEKTHFQDLTIDLEGIDNRIVELPVAESLYEQIIGLPNKVLFTEFPLTGELEEHEEEEKSEKHKGVLWCYDFKKQELQEWFRDVSWMETTPSAQTLLYISGNRIRVVEAVQPVPDENERYPDGEETLASRKNGWLDLTRVRISVDYTAEWEQMFRETWRLQREFFWRKDLCGVDWNKIYVQYAPLVKRVGARSELSDLIWEMQGELGTSHAYEYGGDYHPSPEYWIGRLGADLEYDPSMKSYVFRKIYQGDIWKKNEHSPLCEPGQFIEEGDCLVAIGGVPLDAETVPGQLLAHQAGQEVLLSIKAPAEKAEVRHVFVKTLRHEQPARYRDWVKGNARLVREKTGDRIGYVHIPDMQARGIAEFHRGFLSQTNKAGLIIDVRYNSGGMVSPLILEKLTHRHLGYDVPRWGTPEAYPYHTLLGHFVVLANEFTGSDGDMFCQSIKMLKLGKIIGKRTWGGVIGIDNRYHLVDKTMTTQPQYSAWFHNTEWSVENYGVDPDIEVEFSPEAYAEKTDPQLESGIQTMLDLLEKEPVSEIRFDPATRQKIS